MSTARLQCPSMQPVLARAALSDLRTCLLASTKSRLATHLGAHLIPRLALRLALRLETPRMVQISSECQHHLHPLTPTTRPLLLHGAPGAIPSHPSVKPLPVISPSSARPTDEVLPRHRARPGVLALHLRPGATVPRQPLRGAMVHLRAHLVHMVVHHHLLGDTVHRYLVPGQDTLPVNSHL